MDTPTKPLLKTKKLKKKDVVAQIANKNLPIASPDKFVKYYSRITLTNKYSCMVLTSCFHILLLISNSQQSLVPSPPTTSRCGPVLLLISTLE